MSRKAKEQQDIKQEASYFRLNKKVRSKKRYKKIEEQKANKQWVAIL
jgi:hypothetical protein